jgi:hypothetical protein
MPFGHSAVDMGSGDELLGIGGFLAGGVPGLLAGAVNSGIRANNLSYRDNVLEGLGTAGLSPGQQLGGVTGLNSYGEGHGLLNDAGVNIGGRNYGVSIAGDPTQGGGVIDGRTTLTVDEAQKRFNTLGPTAPGGLLSAPTQQPAGGLLTTPSTPGMATPAAPTKAPAAPKATQAQISAARSAAVKAGPLAREAFDASMRSLGANPTASQLSQAGQLAKSGRSMQQGTAGVSGSQIKGGQTVGNNPNDRSGRNKGAPSKAGAGGRLGGGV